MEYFVLLVTVITMFFGLLFYSQQISGNYTSSFKDFLTTITMIVIISSNILVILMVVYDIFVRRKKDKKKEKAKKKALEEIKEDTLKQQNVFDELHGVRIIDLEKMEMESLPWDQEFKFKISLEEEIISEDETSTLNDILFDLFSWKRLKKKLYLLDKKRQKTQSKVMKLVKVDESKLQDGLTKVIQRKSSLFELKDVFLDENSEEKEKKRISFIKENELKRKSSLFQDIFNKETKDSNEEKKEVEKKEHDKRKVTKLINLKKETIGNDSAPLKKEINLIPGEESKETMLEFKVAEVNDEEQVQK